MFVTSESLVSHVTVLVSSALCYIFRGTHLMLTGTLFLTGAHVRRLDALYFQLKRRRRSLYPSNRRSAVADRPTPGTVRDPVQLKKRKNQRNHFTRNTGEDGCSTEEGWAKPRMVNGADSAAPGRCGLQEFRPATLPIASSTAEAQSS
jgi:hypothetical protein